MFPIWGRCIAALLVQALSVSFAPQQFAYTNGLGVALLTTEGSVITWGSSTNGGDSSAVAASLRSGVVAIYASHGAFAALKSDGSAVVWGSPTWGGDASSVADSLTSGIVKLRCSNQHCMALKDDGKLVQWGYVDDNPQRIWYSSVADSLINVVDFAYALKTYAAWKADGTVICWGDISHGGQCTPDVVDLSQGFQTIVGNREAFAALMNDGSVKAWGNSESGGLIPSGEISTALASGVTSIVPTHHDSGMSAFSYHFHAYKSDGTVVIWGGGWDLSRRLILSDVRKIVHGQLDYSRGASAVLFNNGTVQTFGVSQFGGAESTDNPSKLVDVTDVVEAEAGFAVLRADGSVHGWGDDQSSLGSSAFGAVESQLQSGVVSIHSTRYAIAAVKDDGSVVAYGFHNFGGSVSQDASSGVRTIYDSPTEWQYGVGVLYAHKTSGDLVSWGRTEVLIPSGTWTTITTSTSSTHTMSTTSHTSTSSTSVSSTSTSTSSSSSWTTSSSLSSTSSTTTATSTTSRTLTSTSSSSSSTTSSSSSSTSSTTTTSTTSSTSTSTSSSSTSTTSSSSSSTSSTTTATTTSFTQSSTSTTSTSSSSSTTKTSTITSTITTSTSISSTTSSSSISTTSISVTMTTTTTSTTLLMERVLPAKLASSAVSKNVIEDQMILTQQAAINNEQSFASQRSSGRVQGVKFNASSEVVVLTLDGNNETSPIVVSFPTSCANPAGAAWLVVSEINDGMTSQLPTRVGDEPVSVAYISKVVEVSVLKESQGTVSVAEINCASPIGIRMSASEPGADERCLWFDYEQTKWLEDNLVVLDSWQLSMMHFGLDTPPDGTWCGTTHLSTFVLAVGPRLDVAMVVVVSSSGFSFCIVLGCAYRMLRRRRKLREEKKAQEAFRRVEGRYYDKYRHSVFAIIQTAVDEGAEGILIMGIRSAVAAAPAKWKALQEDLYQANVAKKAPFVDFGESLIEFGDIQFQQVARDALGATLTRETARRKTFALVAMYLEEDADYIEDDIRNHNMSRDRKVHGAAKRIRPAFNRGNRARLSGNPAGPVGSGVRSHTWFEFYRHTVFDILVNCMDEGAQGLTIFGIQPHLTGQNTYLEFPALEEDMNTAYEKKLYPFENLAIPDPIFKRVKMEDLRSRIETETCEGFFVVIASCSDYHAPHVKKIIREFNQSRGPQNGKVVRAWATANDMYQTKDKGEQAAAPKPAREALQEKSPAHGTSSAHGTGGCEDIVEPVVVDSQLHTQPHFLMKVSELEEAVEQTPAPTYDGFLPVLPGMPFEDAQ